jgi:hypothetical protein
LEASLAGELISFQRVNLNVAIQRQNRLGGDTGEAL